MAVPGQEPAAEADPRAITARAMAALERGDEPLARALYETVLAMRAGYYHPFAHVGLASLARMAGRPEEGLGHVRRAVELLAPMDASVALVRLACIQAHEEAGRCYLTLGLPDLAASEIDQQRALARNAEPLVRYAAATAVVDLELARGDAAAAIRACDLALADAELCGSSSVAVPGLRLRRLFAEKRRTFDPNELRTVAAELESLVRTGELTPTLRWPAEFQTAVAWFDAGFPERAIQHTRRLLNDDGPSLLQHAEVLALHTQAELARGASGDELRTWHRRLGSVVERLFHEWRTQSPRYGGLGRFLFDPRRDIVCAQLALDKAMMSGDQAATAAFDHLEAALSLGSVARRMGAKPRELAWVQAELVPERGGVLAYALSLRGGHMLAIERDRVDHVALTLDDAFEADLRWLTAAVERASGDEPVGTVAELRLRAQHLAHRLLPASVRERVRSWRRLVVLDDDQVPASVWQSLPWGEGWLGTEVAVSFVPSAGLAAFLRGRAAERLGQGRGSLDLAVVGDPTHAAESIDRWGVLPVGLTPKQRALLASTFATGGSRVWWGADATAGVLRRTEIANARVLCVIAHGVHDFERERFAGILLAPEGDGNGVMFAEAIEQLTVPPLVVVASCGTLTGPQRVGDDGAGHLGGAFLVAGADRVLSASGDLPLGATLDVLRGLLVELAKGTSAAEGLRRARLAVAGRPGLTHPYYFSGLRLLGIDGSLR